MSANERRFREAAKDYAARKSMTIVFARKGKEIVCKITCREEWTKMFFFDGKDTISIKNRLSEPWGDMISVEAFELAYGRGA